MFLKGCGLACQWCSNPECISAQPEIGFFKALCTKCGGCLKVCPHQALSGEAGQLPVIDRKLCSGCGECAGACQYSALVLYGKPMNEEEVFAAVERDALFYEASGGGVTVSGGEALLQPQFVFGLFTRCRQARIHTCVETAGQAEEGALRQVLPETDLVLFDLKHMDSKVHKRYTGRPNDQVLANAKVVATSGVEFLFRLPLIPDVNDDAQNIRATADFLRGLGPKAQRIELMPYHRLGTGKYESLGKIYTLNELNVPAPEGIERVKRAFTEAGMACTVSQ